MDSNNNNDTVGGSAAADITPWEIYRNSAVGISLTNALNTMLDCGEISTDQALLVLEEYDGLFQLRLRDNLAVDGSLRELSIHVSGAVEAVSDALD